MIFFSNHCVSIPDSFHYCIKIGVRDNVGLSLVFSQYRIQILAETPTILTEMFVLFVSPQRKCCDRPLSFDAGIKFLMQTAELLMYLQYLIFSHKLLQKNKKRKEKTEKGSTRMAIIADP